MWQYVIKVTLTVVLVVAVSEIAKRSSFWGAVVASLPLVSLLAFVWLYLETGETERVAQLSIGILWLMLASLPLFLVLPALLRSGWPFWPSFGFACLATVGVYFGLVWLLGRYGVRL